MTAAEVTVVIRDLLTTAVLLAAPPVLTSLVVGVLVSILQTVTSIQEQTLSFVPRILAVSAVIIVTLPWSIKVLCGFAYRMMTRVSGAALLIELTMLHLIFVLIRVASFVSFFPVFSGRRLPRLVKVGLAVSLTAVWAGQVKAVSATAPAWDGARDGLQLTILALREIVLGAGLGFTFGLLIEPARMAGAYIGQEMGLSLASVTDPNSGGNVTVVGQLFEWIAVVMLFALNVHHVLLHVLNLSFATLRAGERALVVPAMELFRQTDVAHDWSLLIVAPVGIVLFLTLISMGLLVRAVPQMNIFSVGFAMRIAIGLATLLLFAPAILQMVARSLNQSATILQLF